MSDASAIEKYVAKAQQAIDNEDYESAKGYLQDIETSMSTVNSALTNMEQGLSKFEAWGEAWKDHALNQPSEVIDLLDSVYRPCIEQIVEIQADDGLSTKVADHKSDVVIRSWGLKDPELIAVILAVCKTRGEALYQTRKGPQPVVSAEEKIRKITGDQHRPFF